MKRVFDLYAKDIFYPNKFSIYKLEQDNHAIHYTSEANVKQILKVNLLKIYLTFNENNNPNVKKRHKSLIWKRSGFHQQKLSNS